MPRRESTERIRLAAPLPTGERLCRLYPRPHGYSVIRQPASTLRVDHDRWRSGGPAVACNYKRRAKTSLRSMIWIGASPERSAESRLLTFC